ncbi:hypothetical protein E6R61_34810 [Streptomyces sp. LRa12]|nr:hypothetical protein E6R61_34810 [Streptomyces sp. LRa12]
MCSAATARWLRRCRAPGWRVPRPQSRRSVPGARRGRDRGPAGAAGRAPGRRGPCRAAMPARVRG